MAIGTRMVSGTQRATRRPQRVGQRPDKRGNPQFEGSTWGNRGWEIHKLPSADNRTPEIFGAITFLKDRPVVAPYRTLAALKADPNFGDGQVGTGDFTTGQHCWILDGTQVHYASNAWEAGAAP